MRVIRLDTARRPSLETVEPTADPSQWLRERVRMAADVARPRSIREQELEAGDASGLHRSAVA
jgi:hypothetical protein